MSIEDAISQAIAEAKEQPPTNEATTCDWIIKPLLEAAGYSRREIEPQTRDANGQFPDYTILPGTDYSWFLEAKAWNVSLADQHANQSLIYAFTNNRRWVVLTNGREWRLYDNNIQGELTGKLVYAVLLKDFDRMAAFLRAIGRESMINGAVEAYATYSRLKAILESELGRPESPTVKAIQKVMKSQFSFERVTGRDIVDALSENSTLAASRPEEAKRLPTPKPVVSATANERPTPAKEPASHAAGSGTHTLQELADSKGALVTGRRPLTVLFPDGEEQPVKTWIDVTILTVYWLDKAGMIPVLPFPNFSKRKRIFLNTEPKHPDRNAKHIFAELTLPLAGTIYVDKHRSAENLIHSIIQLNPACSDIRVQIG